jgi:hypothetical protein
MVGTVVVIPGSGLGKLGFAAPPVLMVPFVTAVPAVVVAEGSGLMPATGCKPVVFVVVMLPFVGVVPIGLAVVPPAVVPVGRVPVAPTPPTWPTVTPPVPAAT